MIKILPFEGDDAIWLGILIFCSIYTNFLFLKDPEFYFQNHFDFLRLCLNQGFVMGVVPIKEKDEGNIPSIHEGQSIYLVSGLGVWSYIMCWLKQFFCYKIMLQMTSSCLLLYALKYWTIISFKNAESEEESISSNPATLVPLKTLVHTLPLALSYLLYMVWFWCYRKASAFSW